MSPTQPYICDTIKNTGEAKGGVMCADSEAAAHGRGPAPALPVQLGVLWTPRRASCRGSHYAPPQVGTAAVGGA
jgi:hypothetical protein